MLADQSKLDAPTFTTADAMAPELSFGNDVLSGDPMAFGLTAGQEPAWDMTPISPSFTNQDSNTADSALEQNSECILECNDQNTPPLDNQSLLGDILAIFHDRNTWDKTPTLPISKDHSRNSSVGNYATNSAHANMLQRRRRRDKPSISTTITSRTDLDHQSEDYAKREKFLERNRLAASKCRRKRKEYAIMLEFQFREERDRRKRLDSEILLLREEISRLKNEALRHGQCDELIKLHLTQMIKRIAKRDLGDLI